MKDRGSYEYPVGTAVAFRRAVTYTVYPTGEWTAPAGLAAEVVESFAPDTGRNVKLADGRILNVPVWDLASFDAFCPDCGQLVFDPSGRPGEDAAWKNHFDHCEPHRERMQAEELAAETHAVPAPALQVVTLVVSYDWTDKIFTHPVLVAAPYAKVSDIVKSYAADSSQATLLDWRVDTYAPIPF